MRGFTGTQYKLLRAISRKKKGVAVDELAPMLDMLPGPCARAWQALLAAGLISRDTVTDRLAITSAGEKELG